MKQKPTHQQVLQSIMIGNGHSFIHPFEKKKTKLCHYNSALASRHTGLVITTTEKLSRSTSVILLHSYVCTFRPIS